MAAGRSCILTVIMCLLFVFISPSLSQALDFEPISEHGFDPQDTEIDFNDYPWSMVYFKPDGKNDGHIYVGTGNSMMNLIMTRLGITLSISPVNRPPEIRRYRPDIGHKAWEKVFDYRDIEPEPEWRTSGIRALAVYRSQSDGTRHLYAGTLGTQPSLWRSATGDPGSWELVWSAEVEGSIRALQEHRGYLYIAVTHEFLDPVVPGELSVFDGKSVSCIMKDGFGNPNNSGIYSLASFNGWLYAGTSNRAEGYEVWKLAGHDTTGAPVKIISAGGLFRGNQAAATMKAFKDHLYVGGLIFAGVNTAGGPLVRGADMVRISSEDTWETVVGPGSVGGIGSGFDKRTNAYLWSLEVFEDELYCGTWDSASFIPVTKKYLPDIRRSILWFLLGYKAARPTVYDLITKNGGELYRSADGVTWSAVFQDGLGNPDNYGVRQLLAHEGSLYIGFANIDEGLEIWRAEP